MTDLQQALQGVEFMDAYLELNLTKDIISEIKAYQSIDRVKIATAAMQGLISNPVIQLNTRITIEGLAIESVQYADALIKELNKQP